jgi:hypothetical protein
MVWEMLLLLLHKRLAPDVTDNGEVCQQRSSACSNINTIPSLHLDIGELSKTEPANGLYCGHIHRNFTPLELEGTRCGEVMFAADMLLKRWASGEIDFAGGVGLRVPQVNFSKTLGARYKFTVSSTQVDTRKFARPAGGAIIDEWLNCMQIGAITMEAKMEPLDGSDLPPDAQNFLRFLNGDPEKMVVGLLNNCSVPYIANEIRALHACFHAIQFAKQIYYVLVQSSGTQEILAELTRYALPERHVPREVIIDDLFKTFAVCGAVIGYSNGDVSLIVHVPDLGSEGDGNDGSGTIVPVQDTVQLTMTLAGSGARHPVDVILVIPARVSVAAFRRWARTSFADAVRRAVHHEDGLVTRAVLKLLRDVGSTELLCDSLAVSDASLVSDLAARRRPLQMRIRKQWRIDWYFVLRVVFASVALTLLVGNSLYDRAAVQGTIAHRKCVDQTEQLLETHRLINDHRCPPENSIESDAHKCFYEELWLYRWLVPDTLVEQEALFTEKIDKVMAAELNVCVSSTSIYTDDVYRADWNKAEFKAALHKIAVQFRDRCGEGAESGPAVTEQPYLLSFNVSLERRAFEERRYRNGTILSSKPLTSSTLERRVFDVHSYTLNVCDLTTLHAQAVRRLPPAEESWATRSGRMVNIKNQLLLAMDAEWIQKQVLCCLRALV